MTPEKHISPISSALLVLVVLQAACGICAADEPGSLPFPPGSPGGSTSCPEGELVFAPQNPHFLDYQERSFEGAGLLTLDGSRHLYGYAPSPVDLSHLRADPGFQAPARGSRYDLRDSGRVTPVKDQGYYGTCWAFASLASLESTGVPAFGTKDYSEKHMANLNGFDSEVDDGGDNLMATAYLTRWGGPVYEEEDPYPGNFKWTASPAGLTGRVHSQEVLFLPCDITRMKEAVVEKGALFTGFRVNLSSFAETPSSTSYYYNGSSDLRIEGSHAVTIVGWDDTFDRSKFATAPPGDGAFICKNSWGTGWGDDGYFYISYYDDSFNNSLAQPAVFTAEPTTNYDTVYQYDPYGWTSSCTIHEPGEWAYAANVFQATGNEKVAAAGFYTPAMDSEYSISIYRGQETLTTQSGTIEDAGFHTIALDNPVRVRVGETFTVCLALKTPGYDYPIIVEKPITGYSSNADASPGESYVSGDGSNWIDISEQNMNVCIKAYTRSIPPPDFTANVTAGPAPLTVQFTDTSTDDPSSWSWDFGDGQTSTEQHPVHTYVLPGNHTVTLSTNDGAETCTEPGYIKVTPVLFGDANEDGAVNQADTLVVLQEVVGLREQPAAGTGRFWRTDVDTNGMIEVGDALFIAQYNVGLRNVWFELL